MHDAQARVAQQQASLRVANNSAQDAILQYGTPTFGEHVATGLKQIDDQAAAGGWTPEAKAAAETRFISGVHRGVSDSLSVSDPVVAANHLRVFGNHMMAEDRAAAWQSLQGPLIQTQAVADLDMLAIARSATAPLTPHGDDDRLMRRMLAITPTTRGTGANATTGLPALLDRYGGDAAKAWAASVMGADALDALAAKRGAAWFGALPAETRNPVAANMGMLEAVSSPRSAPTSEERAQLAKEIEDQPWSDVRKQNAYDELNTRIGLAARRDREAQDTAKESGLAMADQLGAGFISINQLPPGVRDKLAPDALAALTLRADRNVHPVRVPAHGDVATDLNQMAASDPGKFSQEDLRLHRDDMTPAEYPSLDGIQQGLKDYPPSNRAVTQQRGWEALGRQSFAPAGFGAPIPQNAVFGGLRAGEKVPSLINASQGRDVLRKSTTRTGGNPVAMAPGPEAHPAQPGRTKPVSAAPDFSIGFGKGKKARIAQGPGRTFFFGGAGNEDTQAYKPDFVKRLIESGIKNASAVPQNATSKAPPSGYLLDAASIPASNNKFPDGVYLQTPGVGPGPSGQYNLIGYSFGAVAAAQQAYADAKMGKVVDNLVLIGAPINADLKAALEASGNIRRILYVDIKGDPIRAGNSDFNYIYNLPTVNRQMASGEGHFYFANAGAQGVARRSTLARQLYALGVR